MPHRHRARSRAGSGRPAFGAAERPPGSAPARPDIDTADRSITLQQHSIDSAPPGSRPILESAKEALGFVPNLYATFAGSPAVLEGYTTLGKLFDESSLDATQRQVVLLTTSVENGCEYCVAAHSAIAGMQNVPEEVVGALRSGEPIADERLEALRRFTRAVVRGRGWAAGPELDAFLKAGHTPAQVLEVVLGVGMKTISNYVNHMAGTPLDEAFQPHAWQSEAARR